MRVVIAGGHGKIALQLERQLAARGDQPVALIRNPDHAADVEAAGAEAAVVDLENSSASDVAAHLEDADAVVFAAGAGPGSGIERKKTVDEGAAVLLADAAKAADVDRIVVVSSIGADNPSAGRDEVFTAYLEAKAAADSYVRDSGLAWTIVRPGSLTNDERTGRVTAATKVERGPITRSDVAAVIVAALLDRTTVGKQFEVVNGDTPIAEALSSL